MKRRFLNLDEMIRHGMDDVIDVRSPAEFAEDHWPGAINLPVLDDAERARVGTIYKQVSPFEAKVLGAGLVAANAARHLGGPLADKPGGWRPLVYCWRGGARSNAFATILRQIGWRVVVVEGGYKAYRAEIVRLLHDQPLGFRFIVLDGNTGTAKTDVLQCLSKRGAQVLDLEALAAHRGSVFGATGAGQPSQKMFESRIAAELSRFSADRPVLVEAESSRIGQLIVPPSLWQAMKDAPRIAIEAPLPARAAYLVRRYRDLTDDLERIAITLQSLVPFQGRERVAAWQSLAATGQFETLAAELMSAHYDPGYARARRARAQPDKVFTVASLDPPFVASVADEIYGYVTGHCAPMLM